MSYIYIKSFAGGEIKRQCHSRASEDGSSIVLDRLTLKASPPPALNTALASA